MARTLNEMIAESSVKYAQLPALKVREGEVFKPISYSEMHEMIKKLGTGLIELGIKKGDHVGLISDNRFEWLLCDLAVLGAGASDVPRGSDTTPQELEFILRHAEIKTTFVENKNQLDKVYAVSENLPDLENMIMISSKESIDKKRYRSVRVYAMQELIQRGEELLKKGDRRFDKASSKIKPDDLATIIYTSGTTGEPKGVMLTHRNIMHNVMNAPKNVPIKTGDRFLSLLPAWHSFERSVEYVLLYVGASNAYSKPQAQVLLKDFQTEKPQYISSVPRIWEALYNAIHYKISKESFVKRLIFHICVKTGIVHYRNKMRRRDLLPRFEQRNSLKRFAEIISSGAASFFLKPAVAAGERLVYSKIRERTGGALIAGISGGGALPKHVDEFFAGIGLRVLEGYGLTETSPIVSVRTFERPVPYTVGQLLPEVEVKIVDENGKELPIGQKGIIMVRGPLVMKGYYKNKAETERALYPDRWLNTGDLGRLAFGGELQITGRAKDTIVLLGGKNIEPLPIEQKLSECRYIQQVMVVGQDKKRLGALIVPNFESLSEYASALNIPHASPEELLREKQILNTFRSEIKNLISPKNGFKAYELITTFELLPKEFEVGRELTQTMKMRRNFIAELYRDSIEEMYR